MTHLYLSRPPARGARGRRIACAALLTLTTLSAAACSDDGADPESGTNPSLVGDGGSSDASAQPSADSGPTIGLPTPLDGAVLPVDAGQTANDASTGLADAGGAAADGSAPMGNCPSAPTGKAGSTANLMLNGRAYTLHIGSSVKPNQPAPLVFSLHGLTMTPASMELMAGWDPVADREGLIIARPAGVGASNGWDLTGTKDFDLMKAIIEDVNAKACVDRKRIYATGFSHGGYMSFALACRLGDIFAAVGPNAGASFPGSCTKRPVPVFAFHGDADGIVSYASGESAVNSWVMRNQCTGSPASFKVGNANCKDWNMCAGNGQVKFCTIPNGGHTYLRAATEALWEFFEAHPLP